MELEKKLIYQNDELQMPVMKIVQGATVLSFLIKVLIKMWSDRKEDKGRPGKLMSSDQAHILFKARWERVFISYLLQDMTDVVLEFFVHGQFFEFYFSRSISFP